MEKEMTKQDLIELIKKQLISEKFIIEEPLLEKMAVLIVDCDKLKKDLYETRAIIATSNKNYTGLITEKVIAQINDTRSSISALAYMLNDLRQI